MAKVLCTLPHASTEINGVKFSESKEGMISEEISEAQANDFTSISGYSLVVSKPKAKKGAADTVAEPVAPADEAATEPTTAATEPAAETAAE